MTRLVFSVSILALLAASPAWAADGSCPSIAVEADAHMRALWPDLSERLREAFDARDDIDGCARVRLSARAQRIEVAVALPDGRAATRTVTRAEDVVPTLAALLLVPERAAPPPEGLSPPPAALDPRAGAVAPDTLPQPSAAASSQRDAAPRPAQAPQDEPNGVGIEFSLTTGARIGDGQAGAGFGVLSFLDIVGWLAGFQGRVNGYETLGGGPSASALELAIVGGRRLRFGSLALDLCAGPALAMMGSSSSSAVNTQNAPASPEVSTHGLTPRLLVGAHLNLSADAVLRWFVGVEGEFGATHGVGDPLPSAAPRLPRWAAGLALGATVGTL